MSSIGSAWVLLRGGSAHTSASGDASTSEQATFMPNEHAYTLEHDMLVALFVGTISR